MRNRDYELVKDGKYNMKAIMQRAWVYVEKPVHTAPLNPN